jgi:hypothetical protein
MISSFSYLIVYKFWCFGKVWPYTFHELFRLFPRMRCAIKSARLPQDTVYWETALFDTVPLGMISSLVRSAQSLVSSPKNSLPSGTESSKTPGILHFALDRILTYGGDSPLEPTIIRPVCDRVRVAVPMDGLFTQVTLNAGDMQKTCRLALFHSPLSESQSATLHMDYWYSTTLRPALRLVSQIRSSCTSYG